MGLGILDNPTGEDAWSIETPKVPDYEGTFNQVSKARLEDQTFNNLGGAFFSESYFYDGKRVIGFKVGQERYSFFLWDPGFDSGPVTLILEEV